MKIKIFECPDKTEIEQKVNSLCKEHEVSRIKLTTTPSKRWNVIYSVMVVYD